MSFSLKTYGEASTKGGSSSLAGCQPLEFGDFPLNGEAVRAKTSGDPFRTRSWISDSYVHFRLFHIYCFLYLQECVFYLMYRHFVLRYFDIWYLPIPYHIVISYRLYYWNFTICYICTAFKCVYTKIRGTFTLLAKPREAAIPQELHLKYQKLSSRKTSWKCLTIPENPWKSMKIPLNLNGPKNFWNGENLFDLQWCSVVLAKDTELATVEAFHQDSIFLSHSTYPADLEKKWLQISGIGLRKNFPKWECNFLVPSSSSSKGYWITYSSLQK